VVAPLATASVAGAAPRGLEIYWIDVEGGAATLIVTPAGESVLVDTGWPLPRDADRIQQAAREAGVSRIDHLVTTHWHGDHVGGVTMLVQRLPVGRFYDHGFPSDKPSDVDAILRAAYLLATQGHSTTLHAGDEIGLRQAPGAPPVSLRVVASDGIVLGEAPGSPQTRPCNAQPAHRAIPDDTSDNYRSVGLRLSFGGFDFLDLGDLTWNVEYKLVHPSDKIGKVDVYQVTHHGLEISSNPVLLETVQPRVAVFNNGPRKGGHPQVTTNLRRLKDIQAIYQMHRNVQVGPQENTDPDMIANQDEKCEGESIKLAVAPDGKSYSVTVGSKGKPRRFGTRASDK